jgi:AcrR family transcriptional regulator
VQDVTVPERWTQERRRQHTRDLLLDAAEEVFARRGFEGASLEEIAEAAGYTRGAIYKHFGGKVGLFLAANARFNDRYVHAFVDVIDPGTPIEQFDLESIAKRWRDMSVNDASRFALWAEFNLYVLRHPEVRPQVQAQREAATELIAAFIEEQSTEAGLTFRMPIRTVARLVVAASDGIQFAAHMDDTEDDLYEAFIEMLVALMVQSPRLGDEDHPEDRKRRRRADPDHPVG